MRIDIEEVPIMRGEWRTAFGRTHVLSQKRMKITLARKPIVTIAEYSEVLLHELLHVWMRMIKSRGAKVDMRKQHEFIYSAEMAVIKKLHIAACKGGK